MGYNIMINVCDCFEKKWNRKLKQYLNMKEKDILSLIDMFNFRNKIDNIIQAKWDARKLERSLKKKEELIQKKVNKI